MKDERQRYVLFSPLFSQGIRIKFKYSPLHFQLGTFHLCHLNMLVDWMYNSTTTVVIIVYALTLSFKTQSRPCHAISWTFFNRCYVNIPQLC